MRRRFLSHETIIYIIVWALLFVAPILMEAYMVHNGSMTFFTWTGIWRAWLMFLPFLVVFVLHNHLLAPMLIFQRRRLAYAAWVLGLMALFMIYQCSRRPHDAPRGPAPPREALDGQRPPSSDADILHPDAGRPPRAPRPGQGPPQLHDGDDHPPLLFGRHDIVSTILLVLMLGMNLGVKLYVRQRVHELEMAERERRTLQQQLEYLKYQINPHFLMNTLNNIHALIDIDPTEAQQTIVDLSHLLRFVLYEGSKPLVPLSREVQFVRDYITLMRQRLSDCVTITMNVPGDDNTPTANPLVPPMVFITFVENAFKHGVSYQHPSFVDISIRLDGHDVVFDCVNSRRPEGEDTHGGVGLHNVRQRLDLLFPGRYTLDIADTATAYRVHLRFPTENQD